MILMETQSIKRTTLKLYKKNCRLW